MFKRDSNGLIVVNRGDSFSFDLFINIGTEVMPEAYALTENDKVLFHIMAPNAYFDDAILEKVFTQANVNEDSTVKISFEHEDTADITPGKYYYEIKLVTTSDGVQKFDTIVTKTIIYFID